VHQRWKEQSRATRPRRAPVRRQDLPRRLWILHDRRIPGSRANIDHIVVAPSGVWIIDAKRYSDQLVQRRGKDLYVGKPTAPTSSTG